MKISLKSKESRGDWIRFVTTIEQIWIRKYDDPETNLFNSELKTTTSIWVRKELVNCPCINLDFGKSYLVMSNLKTKEFMGINELILNQKDIAEEWNDQWDQEFSQFSKLDNLDKCDRFKKLKRYLKKSSYKYDQYERYS